MEEKCKYCETGKLKASSNYRDGSEEVCYKVCLSCGIIDEESITYG